MGCKSPDYSAWPHSIAASLNPRPMVCVNHALFEEIERVDASAIIQCCPNHARHVAYMDASARARVRISEDQEVIPAGEPNSFAELGEERLLDRVRIAREEAVRAWSANRWLDLDDAKSAASEILMEKKNMNLEGALLRNRVRDRLKRFVSNEYDRRVRCVGLEVIIGAATTPIAVHGSVNLKSLDPVERKIVEMRFIDGLSESEASRESGLSKSTVHRRSCDAIRKLRLANSHLVRIAA